MPVLFSAVVCAHERGAVSMFKYREFKDVHDRNRDLMVDRFFFSSRRRHTRYWRDWSSDVCSSDLGNSFCMFAATADRSASACAGRTPGFMRPNMRTMRSVRLAIIMGSMRKGHAVAGM